MLSGGLFTQYFLRDGIRDTTAYHGLDGDTVEQVKQSLAADWFRFIQIRRPSEAETEHEFIYPALRHLGWSFLVQPAVDRRRRDVADALLFLDDAAKQRATPLPPIARIRHGTVIVENEARLTQLDRASAAGEAPSSQLLRYMSRADVQSNGTLRWGLLTNGGTWRLYYDRVPSRAEGYVEADLVGLLDLLPLAPREIPPGAPDDHWLRVFLLLFRPQAFQPMADDGPSFLVAAIEQGKDYRSRVTDNLSTTVFDRVFPRLLQALTEHDPRVDVANSAWHKEARAGAIRLLYRLLFVLYAEDRNLLPMRNGAYRAYSLRTLRREAARMMDEEVALAASARGRWSQLLDVFRAISVGDTALGLPPYNGSLFRDQGDDILVRTALPDRVLVPLVDAISRDGELGRNRPLINFRDLSVQHLGSIYEKLLEHEVVPDGAGGIRLRPQPYARKNSGSFYTAEELVELILRQAVQPLVNEKWDAFAAVVPAEPPEPADSVRLQAADPARAILSLRVCDPAMGSGHFLVSLVDRLTDQILLAMAEARAAVPGGDYVSPLAEEVAATRARIILNARAGGWEVDEATLDDKHIVRRMVLKRCVFGVDLNPMAVELAKLSLWLHSFTVGAPLSFLDHHLRCGDSLFGEFVGPALSQMEQEFGLMQPAALQAAQTAAGGMATVETRPDLDAGEVRASREEFQGVEAATASLRAFLDLYHAMRWIPAAGDADRIGRQLLLDGRYGDPLAILAGAALTAPANQTQRLRFRRAAPTPATDAADSGQASLGLGGSAPELRRRRGAATPRPEAEVTAGDAFAVASDFVAAARGLLEESRFFHWEVAFPGVWSDWASGRPSGGFDAVIGNPPWDRIKMQEVEWWAARRDEVARLTRAVDRKVAIRTLRAAGDPLAAEYDYAAARRKRAAEVARFLPKMRAGVMEGPYALYPLFAKGDVNLYALFTERAGQLIAARGVVGLLVPSGVAADKGAAGFFRSISGTGRLSALLDFENGKRAVQPFFPAVHRSFKFSAFVHGGVARRYVHARCAFFQDAAEAAERNAFAIAPAEFAAVNPNTGTAPVFRSPADARRVLDVYGRLPVLRASGAAPTYPVAYATQLHMTNNSDLFRSAEELDEDGAYPVAGGQWERGNTRFFPLMVGRSIHLFDHRFASVMEDEEAEEAEPPEDEEEEEAELPRRARRPTRSRRVHNPYTSQQTTEAEHADLAFLPRPRFWVEDAELAGRWPEGLGWALAFRDIARPTDVRTVIAAVVPRAAFGNKLPLLLPDHPPKPTLARQTDAAMTTWRQACDAVTREYKRTAPLLLGNLSSLALDYIARNKVQSTNLNRFILEQLPVVRLDGFGSRFGQRTAEEVVRADVLALTYTAHDLAPFARDQGHAGPPFQWNEEGRLRRRARLDAVFFLLFGMNRATAGAVMDTFPILRRMEEERYGRFRTRALVLHMMAALEAGNPDAQIDG